MADSPSRVPPVRRPRGWVILAILAVLVAGITMIALFTVPARTAAREVWVGPGSVSNATFTLPSLTYVTIRFHSPQGMPMNFGMGDPGGGMMFHRQGMMADGSYSFWSSGGPYRCWVGSTAQVSGMHPVWINATWALL